MLGLVEAQGLEASCVPRIATGFGAGFGRCGEVCGALVGAVMALGLRFGRESASDNSAKEAAYSRVDELLRRFQRGFGSVRCFDLTCCDMRTEEGQRKAAELDLHRNLCPKFVGFAAETAEELLRAG